MIYTKKQILLSNVGYASHAKLYRSFYSLTGHSVKEYVRKRRLSNALALIKTSDMGLADIAFQCGYSSHQALCRAVRQILVLESSVIGDYDRYADMLLSFARDDGMAADKKRRFSRFMTQKRALITRE